MQNDLKYGSTWKSKVCRVWNTSDTYRNRLDVPRFYLMNKNKKRLMWQTFSLCREKTNAPNVLQLLLKTE